MGGMGGLYDILYFKNMFFLKKYIFIFIGFL